MDETEIANVHWLEYMHFLRLDSASSPDFANLVKRAMPDTNVWVRDLSFNDPYRDHYLRYPGFRYYPIVGVTWEQAIDFCRWRSKKVNLDLARKGSGGSGDFRSYFNGNLSSPRLQKINEAIPETVVVINQESDSNSILSTIK
jgi:hypothetical protein